MRNATRFVGLDVHADTIAVALAEEGRDGEVRLLGIRAPWRHRVRAPPVGPWYPVTPVELVPPLSSDDTRTASSAMHAVKNDGGQRWVLHRQHRARTRPGAAEQGEVALGASLRRRARTSSSAGAAAAGADRPASCWRSRRRGRGEPAAGRAHRSQRARWQPSSVIAAA